MFSDYKRLEKSHGPDKTIGILNRIYDELEKNNYIKNIKYTEDDVRKKATQIYQNILMEIKNDSFQN